MRIIGIITVTLLLFSCTKESPVTSKSNKEFHQSLSGSADRKTEASDTYREWETRLFVFGTRCKPCGDPGPNCYCDGEKGICLIFKERLAILPGDTTDLSPGQGYGEILVRRGEIEGEGQVRISIAGDYEINRDSFYRVLEDHALSEEVCHALGMEEIILKQGEYPVNYESYEHGQVIIPALVY